MKKMILAALVLALVLTLMGCGAKAEMKEALDRFMTSLVSGGEDAGYIDSNGEVITGISNDGIAGELMQRVTYKVLGAKDAEVTLEISAPDAVFLVEQAVAGMDTFDADRFLAEMEILLAGEMPMRAFTVNVQMQEVEERWYPVLSSELINALTGGMPEAYAAVQQQIIESLMKGETQ